MGTISPLQVAVQAFAATAFSTVEVRTNATPPMVLEVGSLGGPGEASRAKKALLGLLKPTVVLRGPAGEKVLAPEGEAHGAGAVVLWAVVAGVLGATFAAGYMLGKDREGST